MPSRERISATARPRSPIENSAGVGWVGSESLGSPDMLPPHRESNERAPEQEITRTREHENMVADGSPKQVRPRLANAVRPRPVKPRVAERPPSGVEDGRS